jgi:putative ABC transport system permease protein
VNITAGSSPTPETIQLAAGKFGEPPLTVHQGWVKEDVDSGIIKTLSGEDLALSLLVLVAGGLFVASATAASVRQRRREIAILSTLGWKARSIFALVIGEAASVGFIAGLLGCALSVGPAAAGSLQIPDGRLALVVPVTVALTVLAAGWPALRAAQVPPMDALRSGPVGGSVPPGA